MPQPLQLRPMNATDLPRVVELTNTVDPEPIDVQTQHERMYNAPPWRIQQRVVAVDNNGSIVGFYTALHDSWLISGHFWIHVIVDKAQRRLGVGMLLFDDALKYVQEQGATHVDSEVRDQCEECLQFAQHHDFSIERHTFESRLDLSAFDESPFAGTIEAVEVSGIRFFTLADVGNTPEAQQHLYEINRAYAADNPGNAREGWEFQSFEAFSKNVFQASWFRADGQIIAADGDKWVGMAAAGYLKNGNTMLNAFTGVDRAYRGRKLGLALKLLAIQYAREQGASSMLTDNDSRNAPVLAINNKLGYQREPGVNELVRTL
jgi:GNAT superfamily N-acetyltransferase